MKPAPFYSESDDQTRQYACALGKKLQARDVIALTGQMGAGKTTFVQGLAEGLGADARSVASPSFVLIRLYRGRIPLVHADLFRLEGMPEAETVGLEEHYEQEVVTVIEWANRIPEVLPSEFLEICFEVTGTETRTLILVSHGASYEARSWS